MDMMADRPAGIRNLPAARLAVALVLSVVVHAVAVVVIRARPPELAGGPSGPVITARLVPEAPGDKAPEAAPDPPEPAQSPAPALPEPVAEPGRPAAEPAVPAKPATAAAAPPPSTQREGGLEVPVFQDPTYYPARMLDEYPRPVAEVPLRYPARASREHVAGKVTLLLLIDESGRLSEASVVSADPSGYFEEAAVAAFREVTFVPGRRNGRAVRSRVLITVAYEPEGMITPGAKP